MMRPLTGVGALHHQKLAWSSLPPGPVSPLRDGDVPGRADRKWIGGTRQLWVPTAAAARLAERPKGLVGTEYQFNELYVARRQDGTHPATTMMRPLRSLELLLGFRLRYIGRSITSSGRSQQGARLRPESGAR